MTYLFCPEILEHIQIDQLLSTLLKTATVESSSSKQLCARPLCDQDHAEYIQLLRNLTVVGEVERDSFEINFQKMRNCPNTYYILVLKELGTNKLVAAATLLVELKFIHTCSKRGHIEDVVVSPEYRGRNCGRILIESLVRLGRYLGCYKLTLDCKDDKIGFYEKFGFNRMYNMMGQRFDGEQSISSSSRSPPPNGYTVQ